jgi:hypothetical protein
MEPCLPAMAYVQENMEGRICEWTDGDEPSDLYEGFIAYGRLLFPESDPGGAPCGGFWGCAFGRNPQCLFPISDADISSLPIPEKNRFIGILDRLANSNTRQFIGLLLNAVLNRLHLFVVIGDEQ